MNQAVSLTFTDDIYQQLKKHLFPGDGLEAVALVLCTRHEGPNRIRLLSKSVYCIPYGICTERHKDAVAWPTEAILNSLIEASDKNYSVVKVHCHPGGGSVFSELDNQSDKALFPCVHGWVEPPVPHVSAIMLPDGSMVGRMVDEYGHFAPLQHINVAGDDLNFWFSKTEGADIPAHGLRVAQAFGKGTFNLFRRLKIGVVGCSGTGNPVVHMLAQNTIGTIVMVDPDSIEHKNLNRLLSAIAKDAKNGVLKVDQLERVISELGFGTIIETYPMSLLTPEAVHAIADCDIIIGCVDSVMGRHLLNRISSYYLIPLFDIGVKLIADGKGGVSHICGTSHFIKPGGSSLLSRRVYTMDDLHAEELKRIDPKAYVDELERGYLKGVKDDQPAVGAINIHASSLAVNDLIARLHGYRNDPNEEYAVQRFELVNGIADCEGHGEPCPVFAKLVALGDTPLLLGMPALDDLEDAA